MVRPPRRPLLAAVCAASLFACRSAPYRALVVVETDGGRETGISTSHGLVFLGRTAGEGLARVIVWFGDGPSSEDGEVLPLATGYLTVPLEVRVPEVEISTRPLALEETLLVAGRLADGTAWSASTSVLSVDPSGANLLARRSSFPPDPQAIGAGAFRWEDHRWRLAGIVRSAADGGSALRFDGIESLWRILFVPRDLGPPPLPPKRPDVR